MSPEDSTNHLKNICGLDDTDDEDNAGELEESGGMRVRPQPRKASTDEVESHVILITIHSDLGAVSVYWMRQGVITTEDRPRITTKCQ